MSKSKSPKIKPARSGAPLEARGRAGGIHADQRPSSRKRRKDAKLALKRGDHDRL